MWVGQSSPDTFRRWMEEVGQDVRYALRQHRRSPGFAVLIVVTLTLGIGGNAAMVGAIDRLLLRAPAHVRAPDRVVRLLFVAPDADGKEHVSASTNFPTFRDLQREVESFQSVAAYSSASVSFGVGPEALEVRASLVSASFFSTVGVRAAIGRLFVPSDDVVPGAMPIAVLGHGFWQRELAGDTGVIGRKLRIGEFSYEVVGVAPAGFRGVESQEKDVWLPIAVAADTELRLPLVLEDRGARWLSIVARLRPDGTPAVAEQQAMNVWRRYDPLRGSREEARRIIAASLIPGLGPDRPREANVAFWLGGVSGLVLLIACANVGNLLLGRAYVRRREIAVRLAIGAGRKRLARQMLAEVLVLAAFGGAGALYLAAIGGRVVERFLLPGGAGGDFLNARLFVITAAIALGTGMLISLAPLVQVMSSDLTQPLQGGANPAGVRASRVRISLLGTQAALCMMLLISAGLFAQSLRRVGALDLGLDLDRTLMAKVDLGRVTLPRAEIVATYEAMLERVLALDGVAHAALAEHDPYTAGRAVAAHTPTRSPESLWHEGVRHIPMAAAVDSGFFRAVGATSLRGRDFDGSDRRGAPRVAIINEPLAKLLWPGDEPLGQCMLLLWEGGDCVTVVGVLQGFLQFSILERDNLVVYLPIAQSDRFIRPGSMFIAAREDPAAVAHDVRRAIQSVRPDLPAISVTPMREILSPQLKPWQVSATFFTIFGGIALVIAAVGLYGVVAFTAAQRSREIAIRIVLGAPARHVLSLVARDGLGAVVVGLVVGGAAALAARRWLSPLLFQTSPSDPWIIMGVGVLLLVVAAVASLIPMVQAVRQDPARTLRVG